MSKKPQIDPPKWAEQFLYWFCPEYLVEGILFDLYEQFDLSASTNPGKAKRQFAWNVLRLLHPYILLRNRKLKKHINMDIYRNHLIVSLRSMKKYKFYASVNIAGLSLAISFVFLSYLFIQNETSFDQFHSKKDRTYRLYGYVVDEDTQAAIPGDHDGCTPVPLAKDLAAGIPSIENYTRFGSVSGTIIQNNTPFNEVIAMADPDFFQMFDFPMVRGNKGALNSPTSLVLSKERATKYFKEGNPIGQSLELVINDSTATFTVTGVVDNKRSKSSLMFDVLIPFERMEMAQPASNLNSYDISFSESWVTFNQPQEPSISKTFSKIFGDKMDMHSGKGMVGIQPLTDVHFNTQIQGLYPAVNPMKVWIMGGLSVLVLIIAVINFITLSVGHSLHRIKEIGLRKTFGANKSNLRTQLIFESLVISLSASLVALALTFYFLPAFNDLIEGTLDRSLLFSHLGFMVALIFLVSTVSGGIQALALVSASPMKALRGNYSFSSGNGWGKQGVIVFQFAMSVLLISGTIIIHRQMNFIQQRDLGFDKERLIEIALPASDDMEATQRLVNRYKASIQNNPMVLSVGASMNGFREPWTQMAFKQEDESMLEIFYNQVDTDYLKTMGMDMTIGEPLGVNGKPLATDILVNETLVKEMGWENPLEEQIPGVDFQTSHRIVGVVKDFHFGSLHQKIEPLIIAADAASIETGIFGISTYVWPPNLYSMVVRIDKGDLFQITNDLETAWKEINPNTDFEFNFVDDMLADKYVEESRWRRVINIASTFAMVIAWIGLIGLTRLSIQKRVKEIGIRKVLGSSILDVVQLLSKHYLLLVLFGSVAVLPLGWWIARQWLDTFSYRINLGLDTFLYSVGTVVLIALCSVGFQAYRASSANPVDSLKCE